MAHEDKCRHGMPPNMCGHYKRPTGDRYELRPGGFYRGDPMVEILKNGGPVHPYDSHFKFDAERARLLLAGRSVIDQFVAKGDEFTLEPHMIQDDFGSIRTWVELHDDFIHSSGQRIQRPWLWFARSAVSIGIGYEKAKAIQALSSQLREWLA